MKCYKVSKNIGEIKKILVFVEYFPPKLGSDRRIYELMKRISKDHKVYFIIFPAVRTLLSVKKDYEMKRLLAHKKPIMMHGGITGYLSKIPYFIAITWRSSQFIAYFLTISVLLIQTMKTFAKIKPDVIVLNYPSPYTGLLGFISGKLWRKPIILDFNDLIAQYTANLLDLKKDTFKTRVLIYVQDYIAKNSLRVIVPTSFIRKYALSRGVSAGKIALIPNGVDVELFNPQKYDEIIVERWKLRKERVCLYFGRLDSWAGINIILKLCALATDRNLSVKFVLVGSGEQKIPKMQNVLLVGEVPYEEVPRILSSADIVLVPFPNNEVSHAASPLKLFEAMSMQKPVIASKVRGIQEIILDGVNGFLADPENIEEWFTKLESLLKSEREAIQIGYNARRTVERRHDWNLLAKQFEKIILQSGRR